MKHSNYARIRYPQASEEVQKLLQSIFDDLDNIDENFPTIYLALVDSLEQSISMRQQAKKDVDEHGVLVHSNKGYVLNPSYRVWDMLDRKIIKILDALCITPQTKQKLANTRNRAAAGETFNAAAFINDLIGDGNETEEV